MSFTRTLIESLAGAERVAVLTGAGISAESGIPTFRDPGGWWQQFRPEDLASMDAFLQNPQLVQHWYSHRRQIAMEKGPNPGHVALAEMERRFERFTLITQNVDNLHQRAGSRNVIELHGNIARNYCVDCKKEAAEEELIPSEEAGAIRCRSCQGLVRPDVTWFGELLPAGAFERAAEAAADCQVFLSIGTSGIVYPAAQLPLIAKSGGAYVAELNLERSAIAAELDEVVLGRAGDLLPRLLEAAQPITKP